MRHLTLAALLLAAPAAAFEEGAAGAIRSLGAQAAGFQPEPASVPSDAIASLSLSQGPCQPFALKKYCRAYWISGRDAGEAVAGGVVDPVDGRCPPAPKRQDYKLIDPSYARQETRLEVGLADGTKRALTAAVRADCMDLETMLKDSETGGRLASLLKTVGAAVAGSTKTYVNQYAFCWRKVADLSQLAVPAAGPNAYAVTLKLAPRVQPVSCASIDLAQAVYEEYKTPAKAYQCSLTCKYRDPMGTLTSAVLTGSGADGGEVLATLRNRCRILGTMQDNEVLSAGCS